MLVSIVTPNFNGSKYIAETIRSVMNQTYENWELIIVDDGSSDDSENIVTPFLSEKIRFIKRPDNRKRGGNVCRNIGIENAKGEYLLFLDSDDLLAPYCLEQRALEISKYPDIDFIVFNMRNFRHKIDDGVVFTRLKTENPLNHFLGQDCIWQTSAPIWKTSFVKRMGMFNEDYLRLQDPEMVVRALTQRNVRFRLLPNSRPDAFYRKTSAEKEKYKPMYESLCMFIEDFYPNKYVNDECRCSMFYLFSFCHFLFSSDLNTDRYTQLIERLEIENKSKMIQAVFFICCKRAICVFLKKTFLKKVFCSIVFKRHQKSIKY